jgi:hypothetical protein
MISKKTSVKDTEVIQEFSERRVLIYSPCT